MIASSSSSASGTAAAAAAAAAVAGVITSNIDFVIDRFFMKLFKTNNIYTVRNCQKEFVFELPNVILARHSKICIIDGHCLCLISCSQVDMFSYRCCRFSFFFSVLSIGELKIIITPDDDCCRHHQSRSHHGNRSPISVTRKQLIQSLSRCDDLHVKITDKTRPNCRYRLHFFIHLSPKNNRNWSFSYMQSARYRRSFIKFFFKLRV